MIVRGPERVLVQGITGRQGSFWSERMLAYGTRIVGGVNPKRAGETCCGVPVHDTAVAAMAATPYEVSVLFIPPLGVKAAALDALAAGCRKLVVLTEHVPLQDTAWLLAAAREAGAAVIGPNTAGLVTPDECFVGFMPAFNRRVFAAGAVGVISRSGSLGTLACLEIVRAGLGISAFIGIGGDPLLGTTTRDALVQLDRDPRTRAVALIGEIGGVMEEDAADYAAAMTKPSPPSSPAAPLRPASGWATPARSSPAAAAATRPSAGRSQRPASRCWRRRPRSAMLCGNGSEEADDAARRSAAHAGRDHHQGLAGAGRCAAAARGRPPGLEPPAPGPAAAGRRAQGVRARPQQPLDAGLPRALRCAPLPARQDHDGAAAVRSPARRRRLGDHGRDRAAAAGLPPLRRVARADGEPAGRPRGDPHGDRRARGRPGLRVPLRRRFAGRRAGAPHRARSLSARPAARGAARRRCDGRPHRLPQRRGRARGGPRDRLGAGARAGRDRGLRGRDGRRPRRGRAQGRGVPRASWSRSRAPAPPSACSRRAR